MDDRSRSPWEERRLELLAKARGMKRASVVDRDELVGLQAEIRDLERRVDRPLPAGTTALRVFPSLTKESPGRVPVPIQHGREVRICPFGRCDGSGWNLRAEEDVADPCACRRLPRDREARRQTRRILRRGLAPGTDSAFFFDLDPAAAHRLRDYAGDIGRRIADGTGLWLLGEPHLAGQATAFLAAEAMRAEIAVLLYPADELIGRLRRLAAGGVGGLYREVYERLAGVELLVIDGLDSASRADRLPETVPRSCEERPEEEITDRPADPYRPVMSMSDLELLHEIFDERLDGLKATVVTSSAGPPLLEDEWLHLPAPGSVTDEWTTDEPRRRKVLVGRLLSRLGGLGDAPLGLATARGSVRPTSDAAHDVGEVRRSAA